MSATSIGDTEDDSVTELEVVRGGWDGLGLEVVESVGEGEGGLYCLRTGALAHLSRTFFFRNTAPDLPNEDGLLGECGGMLSLCLWACLGINWTVL